MPTSPTPKDLLKIPSNTTLKKYGLTLPEWEAMAQAQDYVCATCHKLPKSGRLNVDHSHIKGWKKLPPDERKKYVRGLACYSCNYFFLRRGMTIQKATDIASYLKHFEDKLHEHSRAEG